MSIQGHIDRINASIANTYAALAGRGATMPSTQDADHLSETAATIPEAVKLVSIAITTPPTKTTYTAGDTFDPAGMVVAATYTNGTQIEVGGYLFSPNTELKIGDSVVTVYYAEAGVSVSTTISITVEKRYDDVFANNTWAQIIEACERNEVPETWVVGNNKLMSIGGKDYRMDIIGKKHDT